jgi:SAM-dependent MidA family methyltransferase
MLPPRNPSELPLPSDAERALNAQLSGVVRDEITHHGPLSFERFMELALYAPGLGYYAAGKEKFGASGDYITASESFPLFGQCLTPTVADVLSRLGGGDILEAGAGSGRLAAELLNQLAARDALPQHYYILDLSAELRARQAQTLRERAPAFFERVCWLDHLPPPGFRGVVFGNELLDAMPVRCFHTTRAGVRERRVDWARDRFVWTDSVADAALEARVATLALPADYESEVGFAAEGWVRGIADRLAAGVVLLIDYGFPRAEYYHRQRAGGTLMCHYRQRAHADPLILVGLQDITAHVDFTAIAAAGTEAGLELLGYTSQAAFLLASGLEQITARSDPADTRAHLALTQQIKKLTLPHEMGELFKVIALGRGIDHRLEAFALQDRRARL